MNVVLHLAVSADGFIARPNGDSDWVAPEDATLFIRRAKAAGCVVVGRKTFEQYPDLFPVKSSLIVVLSKNFVSKAGRENILVASSPRKAITLARAQGYKEVLVGGGAATSATFLKAGLVNEIFLSVHPLILGKGMDPFVGVTANLKLLDYRKFGKGLVELHYKVR